VTAGVVHVAEVVAMQASAFAVHVGVVGEATMQGQARGVEVAEVEVGTLQEEWWARPGSVAEVAYEAWTAEVGAVKGV
jgi:ATP-dependent DNA ligase